MKRMLLLCLGAVSACGAMNPTMTTFGSDGGTSLVGAPLGGGFTAQAGGSAGGVGPSDAGQNNAGGSAGGIAVGGGSAGGIAAGGGSAGGASAGGAPTTITVEGTVMTSRGVFVSSATVAIPGKAPVTTGAGGRFTITGVQPPYDIVIFSGVSNRATMYRGLNRANPRLMFLDGATTSERSTASMQLAFGQLLPSTSTTSWFVGRSIIPTTPDTGYSSGMAQWVGSSDTLAFDYTWWNSSPINTSVGALQVLHDLQTEAPIDFTFGSVASVPLVANAIIPVNLNMGPVTTSVLNATINVPVGGALESASVVAKSGNHSFRVFDTDSSAVAIKVPNLPQPGFLIDATATDNIGNYVHARVEGLTAGGAQNTVNFPQSPRLSLPINNAVGIDPRTQTFSWIPVAAGSVAVVTFATANLTIDVVTFDNRTEIPDLASLGLGTIPSGATVTWSVTTYTSPQTMDGFVDPTRAKLSMFGTWQADTLERSFTAR